MCYCKEPFSAEARTQGSPTPSLNVGWGSGGWIIPSSAQDLLPVLLTPGSAQATHSGARGQTRVCHVQGMRPDPSAISPAQPLRACLPRPTVFLGLREAAGSTTLSSVRPCGRAVLSAPGECARAGSLRPVSEGSPLSHPVPVSPETGSSLSRELIPM